MQKQSEKRNQLIIMIISNKISWLSEFLIISWISHFISDFYQEHPTFWYWVHPTTRSGSQARKKTGKVQWYYDRECNTTYKTGSIKTRPIRLAVIRVRWLKSTKEFNWCQCTSVPGFYRKFNNYFLTSDWKELSCNGRIITFNTWLNTLYKA